jgi:midasin (ATPase involved in ribosome maturation)
LVEIEKRIEKTNGLSRAVAFEDKIFEWEDGALVQAMK